MLITHPPAQLYLFISTMVDANQTQAIKLSLRQLTRTLEGFWGNGHNPGNPILIKAIDKLVMLQHMCHTLVTSWLILIRHCVCHARARRMDCFVWVTWIIANEWGSGSRPSLFPMRELFPPSVPTVSNGCLLLSIFTPTNFAPIWRRTIWGCSPPKRLWW